MRISDWSSDVCSSDLAGNGLGDARRFFGRGGSGRLGAQGIVDAAHAVPAFAERPLERQADLVLAARLVSHAWQRVTLVAVRQRQRGDRKSTRLNSSH